MGHVQLLRLANGCGDECPSADVHLCTLCRFGLTIDLTHTHTHTGSSLTIGWPSLAGRPLDLNAINVWASIVANRSHGSPAQSARPCPHNIQLNSPQATEDPAVLGSSAASEASNAVYQTGDSLFMMYSMINDTDKALAACDEIETT